MKIIEALEEVSGNTPGINTFLLADLNEANNDADKLADAEYPVLYILPFSVVDSMSPGGSAKLKGSFQLQGFLLTKDTTQKTVDYSSTEIEANVIAPMRLLARRFIHGLAHHEIIDPESQGVTGVTYDPVYSQLDANLFGVVINATVPVMEHVENNACLP